VIQFIACSLCFDAYLSERSEKRNYVGFVPFSMSADAVKAR